MSAIACQKCATVSRDGAKFCIKCGTSLQAPQVRCASCGTVLSPDSAFCDHCGTAVGAERSPVAPDSSAKLAEVKAWAEELIRAHRGRGPQKPTTAAVPETRRPHVECPQCAHYRPSVDLSPGIGGLLKGDEQVAAAMAEIRKEEMELRAAESQERADLIMNAQASWSHMPLMEPYCASRVAQDVFGLCEVKNRAGNCGEFEPRAKRKIKICGSCKHRLVPNPIAAYPDPADPEAFRAMFKARDADQATELKYVWSSKGWANRQPTFQQHCVRVGVLSGKGVGVLPYVNVRNDCAHHESDGFNFEGDVEPIGAIEEEMVIFASQWMKTYRTEGPEQLVSLCSSALKAHSSGQMLHLVEELANKGAIALLAKGALDLSGHLMALAGPEAIARANHSRSLANRLLGGNMIIAHLPANTPAKAIIETLLQTIAEQFCLEHWAPEAQVAFCRTERLRLEHGMYPDVAKEQISILLKELELKANAFERASAQSSNVGYNSLVVRLYPISFKPYFELAQIHLPGLNVGQPIPYRELRHEEKAALARFAAGHLDAATIPMLHAFANDNVATAKNIVTAFQRTAINDRSIEIGLQFALRYEQAAILSLRVANHIGRVAIPTTHKDVSVAFATEAGPRWLAALKQSDPVWQRAIEQTTASLFNVVANRYLEARNRGAEKK